jgi:hypothetical protein
MRNELVLFECSGLRDTGEFDNERTVATAGI